MMINVEKAEEHSFMIDNINNAEVLSFVDAVIIIIIIIVITIT